jgi:hypothetical protein
VIGVLLIAVAVGTALLLAATARLTSLVSTLLAAYLAFVSELVVVVLMLSPFRGVNRWGLAVAEVVLLALALGGWYLRGRPGLPLAAARPALAEIARRRLTVVFLCAVAVLLGYELVLALAVPVNNFDSLWYHLPRAIAWLQHGGWFWIPNAPSDILNTRQPVAEQELLFLLAATGKTSLFALPQYMAGLALLLAVYGSSRRLGYSAPAAACAMALLATFSLVSLEASTAQNDLVAASFPAIAACLLLGSSRSEHVLAGAALGIGLGVKLTTLFVWPVLVLLAVVRGRGPALRAAVGAVAGFVVVGMWGYGLNLVHTGRVLGQGRFQLDVSASPGWPRSGVTALDLLYETMDLSVLSDRRIHLLAIAGVVVFLAVAAWGLRRAWLRWAVEGGRAAVPFVAPLVVLGAAGVLAWLGRRWGYPIRGSGAEVGPPNRAAAEDYSAFGPIGAVVVLGVSVLAIADYGRRRVDARYLALALAFPTYFALIALELSFNIFVTRFLLVPVVLTAPLFGRLFRSRVTIAAYLVAASIVGGLVIVGDDTKSLTGTFRAPWNLNQAGALRAAGIPDVAGALEAYDRLVPPRACVGAVLGGNEPSAVLAGLPDLRHRVIYLSVDGPLVDDALRAGLFYVVISTGTDRTAADVFRNAGWRIQPLGSYWLLASEPGAGSGRC